MSTPEDVVRLYREGNTSDRSPCGKYRGFITIGPILLLGNTK
jgi:hypothetical protein